MSAIEAVLFDLDGTLADTAPALAFALNETLKAFGREPMPFEAIRPVVSHGGIALIRLGFGMEPEQPGFEERRQHLLKVYLENICRETRLFPGMESVLEGLAGLGIPWGIVTNKPEQFVAPLLEQMGLDHWFDLTVGGDTLPVKKPDPAPLLHAMETLGGTRGTTVMVGDSAADINAALAAGIPCVAVRYGYNYGPAVDTLGADAVVDSLAELL